MSVYLKEFKLLLLNKVLYFIIIHSDTRVLKADEIPFYILKYQRKCFWTEI